jgi:hypothetical protein
MQTFKKHTEGKFQNDRAKANCKLHSKRCNILESFVNICWKIRFSVM